MISSLQPKERAPSLKRVNIATVKSSTDSHVNIGYLLMPSITFTSCALASRISLSPRHTCMLVYGTSLTAAVAGSSSIECMSNTIWIWKNQAKNAHKETCVVYMQTSAFIYNRNKLLSLLCLGGHIIYNILWCKLQIWYKLSGVKQASFKCLYVRRFVACSTSLSGLLQ